MESNVSFHREQLWCTVFVRRFHLFPFVQGEQNYLVTVCVLGVKDSVIEVISRQTKVVSSVGEGKGDETQIISRRTWVTVDPLLPFSDDMETDREDRTTTGTSSDPDPVSSLH